MNDGIVSPLIPQDDAVEIWRDIPGYEGVYQASSLGRIRGLATRKGKQAGRIIQGYSMPNGYRYVHLCHNGEKNTVPAHRVILLAFDRRPDSHLYEVRHKNGNRADNRPENLEWVTHAEALTYSIRHVNKRPRAGRTKHISMTPQTIYASLDLADEQWRDIPGYGGDYQVSTCGRVKAMYSSKKVKAGQILEGYVTNRYHFIRLSKNGFRKAYGVHRLVMMTFASIEGYQKLDVNHIDGNPSNNRIENLEWATRSENILHAIHVTKTKKIARGQDVPNTPLTDNDVRSIRQLYTEGTTQTRIAQLYNVSQVTICKIVNHQTWTHIE